MEQLYRVMEMMLRNEWYRKALATKKVRIQSQIFEIVFYGKGGYDYDTVYNMPIYLRNFTYHKVVEHYEKEAEAAEKAGKGQSLTKSSSPKIPDAVQKQMRKPDLNVKRPS